MDSDGGRKLCDHLEAGIVGALQDYDDYDGSAAEGGRLLAEGLRGLLPVSMVGRAVDGGERETGRREASLAILNALAGRTTTMQAGAGDALVMVDAMHVVCVEMGTGYPSRDSDAWEKFR